MGNELSRYITGELTPDEKQQFLSEVAQDENLKKEYFEVQNMMTLIDWVLVEGEIETAQRKLAEFMDRLNNNNLG